MSDAARVVGDLGREGDFIATQADLFWEAFFELQREWTDAAWADRRKGVRLMIQPSRGRAFGYHRAGAVVVELWAWYRWDDVRDDRSVAELSEPVFFVEVERDWERNILRWLIEDAGLLVDLTPRRRTGKRMLMWNMATIGAAFHRKRVRQMTEILRESQLC